MGVSRLPIRIYEDDDTNGYGGTGLGSTADTYRIDGIHKRRRYTQTKREEKMEMKEDGEWGKGGPDRFDGVHGLPSLVRSFLVIAPPLPNPCRSPLNQHPITQPS
jgi:hypothetical protein